jgi:hypothetical protein
MPTQVFCIASIGILFLGNVASESMIKPVGECMRHFI